MKRYAVYAELEYVGTGDIIPKRFIDFVRAESEEKAVEIGDQLAAIYDHYGYYVNNVWVEEE